MGELIRKYIVGIMNNKWSVDAASLDVAIVAVRITQHATAPVVCFNSREQSKFASIDWYTESDLKQFCDDNKDAIKSAIGTISDGVI